MPQKYLPFELFCSSTGRVEPCGTKEQAIYWQFKGDKT